MSTERMERCCGGEVPLLLKGGRIFDGERFLDGVTDVLLEDGRVRALGKDLPSPEGAKELQLAGLLVCPGFIDLHGHFRDPGQTWCEDLVSGSLAAAAGGYAVAVAMPNTLPPLDNDALVRDVIERGRRAGGARILPAGCVSKERKGEEMAELAAMADAGAVFFTDDGAPVLRARLLRNALLYTKDLGVRVLEHPEEKDLTKSAQVTEGRCSALSGMRGFPISAEVLGVLRALVLARETNCAVHLTHVSTAAALEAIRAAKADGVEVTCDVTPHHLVLSEEDVLRSNLHAAFKVNPPLRSTADRDALWRGIADGTVDAIATDHAPWHEDEKDLPFQEANFGIASYECAVGAVLDYRRNAEPEVPLERLLALWTSRPGALLPRSAAFPGRLAEGLPAHVTVVDPESAFRVDPALWRSKARITPYKGRHFTGRPVLTVVAGKIVFSALEGGAVRV